MTTICFGIYKRQPTYLPTRIAFQKYNGGELGKNEVQMFFAILFKETHVHFELSRVSA